MRVTTLNQIFGMLAATATWRGAEAALAQNAAAYAGPACGHYPYPPCY
jgi:hypothetical protein